MPRAGRKADGRYRGRLRVHDRGGAHAQAAVGRQPFRPFRSGGDAGPAGRARWTHRRRGLGGDRAQFGVPAVRRRPAAGFGHPGLLPVPRPGRAWPLHHRGLPRPGAGPARGLPGPRHRSEPALRRMAGARAGPRRCRPSAAVVECAPDGEPGIRAWHAWHHRSGPLPADLPHPSRAAGPEVHRHRRQRVLQHGEGRVPRAVERGALRHRHAQAFARHPPRRDRVRQGGARQRLAPVHR